MTKATTGLTRREIAAALGIAPADVDKPLTTRRVCEVLGNIRGEALNVGTWRGYVKRANDERAAGRGRPGLAPAPDGREPLSGLPYWMPEAIAVYVLSRPGRGARTDLTRES